MEGSILIVDDDSIVIRSCEAVLKPEGYDVKGTTSAKDAMEILKSTKTDIVITDLRMPEIDGVELIRWIKDEKLNPGIVVITGYPSQETLKDTLELGIIDYLPKPFSPHVLIEVVTKAISFMKAKPIPAPQEEVDINKQIENLRSMIKTNKNKPGALIPVLQQAQEIIGYLPPSVQRIIAKGLKVPVSEVHAVVSFYSFFTMIPKGKHNVKVCMGTACYVKRANEILQKMKEHLNINEGDVTEDKLFSLETVRCLGACGLAPVVIIGHDTHGAVDPVKAPDLLQNYN